VSGAQVYFMLAADAKARILVIEDDESLRRAVLDALRSGDYAPQGAADSSEALALAAKTRYELILSDIRMPGPLDGLGAVAAIKALQPTVKSIIMTGYAGDDAPRRAVQLQVYDYVHKPFRVAALLQAVRRVLRPTYGCQASFHGLQPLLTMDVWPEQAEVKRIQHLAKLLEGEKQAVLRALFVGLRARQMSRLLGLDAWDQLEALELEAADVLNQPREAALIQLGVKYRRVYEQLVSHDDSQLVETSEMPRPGQVSQRSFNRLTELVRDGTVDLDDLGEILVARHEAATRLDLRAELREVMRNLSR
jgi:CheY-like chemotaxis protein